MNLETFLIFAVTTFVVIITPGPAAITVATQASGNGVLRTGAAIAGVAFANVVFFTLSATGISAMIIASETLFFAIKWFGVAYLCYLGAMAIFSKAGGLQVGEGPRTSLGALFGKGFVVEFANPKALLYFAAILPQFLDLNAALAPQFAIMGLTTLFFDALVYSGYAGLGAQISRSGIKPSLVKHLNRLAGGALLYSAFRIAKVAA